MKKLVLLKFVVTDKDPDSIFEEVEITKLVKITNLDEIEEKVIEKFPDFLYFTHMQVVDTNVEPSILIVPEDNFNDSEGINGFVQELAEKYPEVIKKIETLNI